MVFVIHGLPAQHRVVIADFVMHDAELEQDVGFVIVGLKGFDRFLDV